jgi:hypothetical protein
MFRAMDLVKNALMKPLFGDDATADGESGRAESAAMMQKSRIARLDPDQGMPMGMGTIPFL